MRILRLDLGRFRHFTGCTIDFAPPVAEPPASTLTLFPETANRLCLVHGENEAGKSTVLDAVKCLLFGFPDRAGHLAIDGEQSALEVSALVEFHNRARAEVRRRKGRQQTLAGRLVLHGGVRGDEVDDSWFHDRMGRPNKAMFDAVFGFSLDTLARGADTLAKEVQGALYGAGFGGAVQPQAILQDLAKSKDDLFTEKAARRRINATKARLDDLRKTIASASASKESLQTLDDELRAKEAAAQERSDRAKKLRAEIEHSTALSAGLAAFRDRERAREELAGLDVPRTFPAGGEVAHQRLVDARERLLEQRDTQQTIHAVAAAEVDALVVDDRLLADADAIDALYRGLEAQRQAMLDVPRCDAALVELRRTATASLALLRPGWDLDAFRAARFDAAATEDFHAALAAHARLAAETTAADAQVRKLEDELASIDARLASLPPVVDARGARAWLAQCSGAVAERKSLDQLERELSTLQRKRAATRRRLDPPCTQTIADPTQLAVPRIEEVDRFAASFEALDERIARLDADLAAHEAERTRIDTQLAEIEAGGHAPSDAELKAARERRDRGWQLVLRALSGEKPDEKTLAAFDGEGRALPRAFEHAVHLADSVVDAMRARADAVQKRAICEVHRARLLEAVAMMEKKRAAAIDEKSRADSAWRAAWSTCGFSPLSPRAMRGWLDDLAVFAELAHDEGETRQRRDQVSARLHDFLQEGATAIGQAPSPTDAPSIERLRGEAQRLVDAEDARGKLEASLVAQRDRDVPRLAAARDAMRSLRAEADRFLARWSSITHALGIARDLSVDAARKVVPDLIELQRSFTRHEAELQTRRATLLDDTTRYREAVAALDRSASDPLAAVPRLHAGLQASREAMRARSEAEKRVVGARAQLALLDEKLEAANDQLARLRALAGVTDDEAFVEVARRAARAHELSRIIDDAERTLLQHRGPWSPAEYEAELAVSSDDALRIDRERLAGEADACEAEVRVLERGVGDVRAQRKRLDGNAAAADALSLAEAERASLREDVERYAVLAVAEHLLSGAIRRFEDEHQPALLTSASRVFAEMTLDRYPRVQRTIADGSLFVERRDGTILGPDQLSTGTREQLYLAIRLAYVEHYARSAEPLPVVLDDVLVNFDDARALATLRALASFARSTQVLLFTCHAHLVALVEQAGLDVTHLSLPKA
jgi:uncharacterized protein YhaN